MTTATTTSTFYDAALGQHMPLSPISEQKHSTRTLVIKITIVILVVLALAAAAYFSFGAALPFIASGVISWSSGLGLVGSMGFSLAALSAPLIGGYRKMYQVTKNNFNDVKHFLFDVSAMALIAGSALIARRLLIYSLPALFMPFNRP